MPQNPRPYIAEAARAIEKGDSPLAVLAHIGRRADEDARFEERLRLVTFISQHRDDLRQFAGDRTDDLLLYMLGELRAADEA